MAPQEHEDMGDDIPVIDPYEILGIKPSASAEQIKTAYRKAALKNHPDKVTADQKDAAHTKFQSIAFAYAVLSDPARRKRYDESGSTSESIVDSDGFSWSDFYREQYCNAVSQDAIVKFAEQYKKSDEEIGDVLAAYTEHEGSMDGVYESVMLSNVLDDDERFRTIIDEAIAAGKVEAFAAYTKETKKARRARVRAAETEAGEAEKYAMELGVHQKLFGKKGKDKNKSMKDREADLAALIQRNRQKRETSFLDKLEDKYGAKAAKGNSRKRGKKEVDESGEHHIPDDVFEAAQAKMLKRAKR